MTAIQIVTFALSCLIVGGLWARTPVTDRWMAVLRPTLSRFSITPKLLAYHMGLSEKQFYAQLALEQPMHAARLEEVWAVYPDAHDVYCIERLTARGYYVCRRDRLADALNRVLDDKKPMAVMTLIERRAKARA